MDVRVLNASAQTRHEFKRVLHFKECEGYELTNLDNHGNFTLVGVAEEKFNEMKVWFKGLGYEIEAHNR